MAMRPYKEKSPSGGQHERHQERRKQPKVGGAGAGEDEKPYESQTGRKGASQNIEGTRRPGEPKR